MAKPLQVTEDQQRAAEEYVDKQLAVMAKYGSAPNLTPEQKARIVCDVLKSLPAHLKGAQPPPMCVTGWHRFDWDPRSLCFINPCLNCGHSREDIDRHQPSTPEATNGK